MASEIFEKNAKNRTASLAVPVGWTFTRFESELYINLQFMSPYLREYTGVTKRAVDPDAVSP